MADRETLKRTFRRRERAKYDEQYYNDEYWKEDLPGKRGHLGLSYDDPQHLERFNYLASVIHRQFAGLSYLDAGTGTGLLLRALQRFGADAIGFDASKVAVKKAREVGGRRVLVSSLEAISLRDRVADVVVCCDVLEHLPVFDIEPALAELARVARRFVVASINTDNPYRFHPTILSRESWETLFEMTGVLTPDADAEQTLQQQTAERYGEYDLFVYRKIDSANRTTS